MRLPCAGKRNVTIEEIREALRMACAEARAREPEDRQAAAAAPQAAPLRRKLPAKGRTPQASAAKSASRKAMPTRKVRGLWELGMGSGAHDALLEHP